MKKNIFLIIFALSTCLNVFSQDEITKIIVARHAEKENDGTKNPSLSEAGKIRAEKLKDLFVDVKIDKLFSTNYKRTIETLQPIAASKKLDIVNYNPNDLSFAKDLISTEKGKTVLVVGHSNTCPKLVNSLIDESKYQNLDENDYGKIWIITFKNDKKIDCILLNY
ncbi:phosphoglycerate mutase family protein [Flavobacterium capsici]|uniref:Phosphoglycerate mutase family protein n=1 Tax=Flavobacterium capsici TaxID=3075618 RepID=A0AA96EWM6_9FLAO|nr:MULTISPECIES: phosphoglycerate mutase family protein [unclassified Flavobacterium]WNM19983.1 phosphoglycerate mutase family protein [Flavobacterium sp. PMR2A8]WNM21372.1 phosphoglycerate mutase family protein [Flavobacterium sp. PMTSA4]